MSDGVRYVEAGESKRMVYRVGDDGSFWSKSKWRDEWSPVKPSPLKSGHMRVSFGREKTEYLHRVVLEAFVGPCPEGMMSCHRNDDPSDNRLDNLYWGTAEDNSRDAEMNGKRVRRSGEDHARAKLTEPMVLEILQGWRDGIPQKELAERYGVTAANVQAIVYGKSWNHVTGLPKYEPKRPGYRWENRRPGDVTN